jgi:hypothetical protein
LEYGGKMQVKNLILFCMFVILFVAMVQTISGETTISSVDVEVQYGNDIDTTETLNITHSQYIPKSGIRLVELSSLDDDYWRMYSDYATTKFNVALRDVSKLVIGITVKTQEAPVNLTMYEWGYPFKNSTFIEGFQTKNHTLEITYTPSNSSSSFRLLDIIIRLYDCSWSDFGMTKFWIDVVTTEELFPVTFDIRRTNGENLFSNPWLNTMGFISQPKVLLNSNTIYPWYVNDTVFVPGGYYSVTMNWANSLIANFTISNDSVVVTWHIKCVRLDFYLTEKLPGLYVELGGGEFYYQPSLLYSPSLYLSPRDLANVRIKCDFYWAFSQYVSENVDYERGQNQNITFIVKPHLLSIGNVLITQGRLQILTFSFIIIIASILVGRKRILKNYRILAYLLIFIGMCLPWMQISQIISTPTIPYGGEYLVTWDINPALFTSFTSQQNASLVMAPSNQPALFFDSLHREGLQGGHLIHFLFVILFLFMIAELFKLPGISDLNDYSILMLFLVIFAVNLLYISTGCSVYECVGYQVGWGSIIIIITVIAWTIHTIHPLVRHLSNPETA